MEPPERIPRDDWADQDLLTRDEAAQRLVAEIKQVSAAIDAGEGNELMERRLAGMKEALAHMKGAAST